MTEYIQVCSFSHQTRSSIIPITSMQNNMPTCVTSSELLMPRYEIPNPERVSVFNLVVSSGALFA